MPEPGVTMDSGFPVKPAAEPPSQPAGQPGYGPNPTAQGVRGYRDLPADDVLLINAVKELQENVANVWAAVFLRPGTDHRWARISRLHLEEGVSALVRSIAQPHDPFRAALQRLAAQADARAQEMVAADMAGARGAEESTVESNSAQPSQDPSPDKPETIADSIRQHGWGGKPE